MLTVAATTITAAPLELLALGFGGLAVVLAVGSAIAAYSSRTLHALDEEADNPAAR